MDPSGAEKEKPVARAEDGLNREDGVKFEQTQTGIKAENVVVDVSSTYHGDDDEPKYSKWQVVVRNFTPSWFVVTTGTGIVSVLLNRLPYQFTGLYHISIVFFCLNVVLFLLFTFISLIRYSLYPEIWSLMIRHPVQSPFIGTFSIGFATIVNMIVFVCVPTWGAGAIWLAWGFWWADAAVSVATCLYLPFLLMKTHDVALERMTAAWLLPIVATTVAAGTGGIVAAVLPNPQCALWTLVTSYVLWGMGTPLSMVVLTMYFHRLTVHKLPPREAIVSVTLPLGAMGQGAFAIMQLGRVALELLPKTHTLSVHAGEILYDVGWLIAIIMWAFGLVWAFFAVASILYTSKFPFNMAWWGFTFPLGVFALATSTFGRDLDSRFFRVLGTIFSCVVFLLWVVVAIATVLKTISGNLLYAPCLKELQPKVKKPRSEKWWKQRLKTRRIDVSVNY